MNQIKIKIITSFILAICLMSCSLIESITPQQMGAGLSLAVSTGLQLGVKDVAKRAVIAQYVYNYAGGLRTVTGSPTPEQLAGYLVQFIPANVATQYPELGTLVVPLIIAAYNRVYTKNKDHADVLYAYLSAAALGLEDAAAKFLAAPTPAPTPAT